MRQLCSRRLRAPILVAVVGVWLVFTLIDAWSLDSRKSYNSIHPRDNHRRLLNFTQYSFQDDYDSFNRAGSQLRTDAKRAGEDFTESTLMMLREVMRQVYVNQDGKVVASHRAAMTERPKEDVVEGGETARSPNASKTKTTSKSDEKELKFKSKERTSKVKTNSEESHSPVEIWEKEQAERLSRISSVCKKWQNYDKLQLKPDEFMFEPDHKLLYCRHGKVGTTTFLSHFVQFTNYSHDVEELSSPFLHKKIPDLFKLSNMSSDALRNLTASSISFTAVRHPFERLVSAYLDKVVNKQDSSYDILRRSIKKIYGEINFNNFIRRVLEHGLQKCRSPFTCDVDVHWRPFGSRCFYCQVQYRVLVKAETFNDDLYHLGRLSKVEFSELRAHKSKGSTRKMTRELFSNLPADLYSALVKLYAADFQMFNYSPQDFPMGNPNKTSSTHQSSTNTFIQETTSK